MIGPCPAPPAAALARGLLGAANAAGARPIRSPDFYHGKDHQTSWSAPRPGQRTTTSAGRIIGAPTWARPHSRGEPIIVPQKHAGAPGGNQRPPIITWPRSPPKGRHRRPT